MSKKQKTHYYIFVFSYHYLSWLAETPVWFKHSFIWDSELDSLHNYLVFDFEICFCLRYLYLILWSWIHYIIIWYLILRSVLPKIFVFDTLDLDTVHYYLTFWILGLFVKDIWNFDIWNSDLAISHLNLRLVILNTNFIFAFKQQNKVIFLTN